MSNCSENKMPKLRFNEFKESWSEEVLGDISKISKGKGISKSQLDENGDTKCILFGQLYTTYNEIISNIVSKTSLPAEGLVFSKSNDVIIPCSGETHIDIARASCVKDDNIALGGDLSIIRSKNNGVFMAYYLNHKKKIDIACFAQGSSVIHLYPYHLKKLQLNLPSLTEQQKIAEFLSSVDKKIQLLEKKKEKLEQYKKGVMQKIFSREIRFKDENGNSFPDWDKKSFEELLDYEQPNKYIVESTAYNDEFNTPVLTAGKTFVLGYTDELEGIFNNLPVIIFDDFTMSNKYVDFPFKVKSGAMKILKPKTSSINLRFIFELMQTINYPSGEEHKRFWISEYSKIKINWPCIKEQKKIADFLSAIDNKIDTTSTQIDKTKVFKKGLLQQMFV